MANNHMHSDIKKRRSFLALLFSAGDVRRWGCRKTSQSEKFLLEAI